MPTIDVNLFIKAPSQYIGFDFNSYANFNGKQLATSLTEGLCQMCCGDDDEGDDIVAYFSPIKTDLGIKNPKKLRYVYFGFKSAKAMLLEVSADDGVVRSYTIPANTDGQQRVRVTIDMNKKGRYWNFKIKNVNGYDFDMDNIQVLPIILTEGFK